MCDTNISISSDKISFH